MGNEVLSKLQNIAATLNSLREKLYADVVIPLADETVEILNTHYGIHLGDQVLTFGQYTLSRATHTVVDICDTLAQQNMGYGPGIYPLGYFADNIEKYGGLAHANCHCYLEPLTVKKDVMEESQWHYEVTDTGIVFINNSDMVNTQIEGTPDQVTEGKVSALGLEPDSFAEITIREFQEKLQARTIPYINDKLKG